MKIFTWIFGGLILVYWVLLLLLAELVFLVLWMLVRPFVTEQFASVGVADTPEELRLMPGPEVDVVPEGVDPRQPHVLYCMRCGRGAHAPNFAADIGACPDCGGERWSNRLELPIFGEPKERVR